VFTIPDKTGGCSGQSEAVCRLISLALKCGIDLQLLTDQLKGIKCPTAIRARKQACPAAIAEALEAEVLEIDLERKTERTSSKRIVLKNNAQNIGVCPECGKSMEFTEGCVSCRHCGFSKCGG